MLLEIFTFQDFGLLCRDSLKTYQNCSQTGIRTWPFFPWNTSALDFRFTDFQCRCLDTGGWKGLNYYSSSLLSRKQIFKSAGLPISLEFFCEICLANIELHRIFTSQYFTLFQMRFPTSKTYDWNGLLDASQCPSHSWVTHGDVFAAQKTDWVMGSPAFPMVCTGASSACAGTADGDQQPVFFEDQRPPEVGNCLAFQSLKYSSSWGNSHDRPEHCCHYRVLKGGGVEGEGVRGSLRIPREDWGTLH